MSEPRGPFGPTWKNLDASRARHQESRIVWFAAVVIIVGVGFTHTMAYTDELALEQERKAAQKKREAQPFPAPIWSQKCERQGKRVLAVQADGGRWEIRCVALPVLKA